MKLDTIINKGCIRILAVLFFIVGCAKFENRTPLEKPDTLSNYFRVYTNQFYKYKIVTELEP